MTIRTFLRLCAICGTVALVAGCGTSSSKIFGSNSERGQQAKEQSFTRSELSRQRHQAAGSTIDAGASKQSKSIWSLFSSNSEPNITVEVNKYLWQASLEVLNFLPIQSVDPFTGVIVTGYGAPPGGGRAYKATIYVSDPALDARSLKVSLESRGGTVSPDTVRAVEDAILTRARQLRVRDSKL